MATTAFPSRDDFAAMQLERLQNRRQNNLSTAIVAAQADLSDGAMAAERLDNFFLHPVAKPPCWYVQGRRLQGHQRIPRVGISAPGP
jgi:hypothetical protein